MNDAPESLKVRRHTDFGGKLELLLIDITKFSIFEKLVTPESTYLFNNIPGSYSTYDLCYGLWRSGELVAGIFLNNYVNSYAIPASDWENWAKNLYGIKYFNCFNVLWVHLFLSNKVKKFDFFHKYLEMIFQRHGRLEYIAFYLPPHAERPIFFQHSKLHHHLPLDSHHHHSYHSDKVFSIYVAYRHDFCPPYVIRKGVEEDNDDLVNLIPPKLKHEYGEFYISDLIRRPDVGREILVAEEKGDIAGLMIINKNVNTELLNTEYQLRSFNFLKKLPSSQETLEDFYIEKHQKSIQKGSKEHIKIKNIIPEISSDSSLTSNTLSSTTSSNTDVSSFTFDISDTSEEKPETEYHNKVDSYSNYLFEKLDEEKLHSQLKHKKKADILNKRSSIHQPSSLYLKNNLRKYEINCFAIEVCNVSPEHKSCIIPLLGGAFKAVENVEYAILAQLHSSELEAFVKDFFVRVAPFEESVFPFELYLANKNALLGHVTIDQATRPQLKEILNFIDLFNQPNLELLNIIKTYLPEDTLSPIHFYKIYCIRCENMMIGLAVLHPDINYYYYNSLFDLPACVQTTSNTSMANGYLNYLLLAPQFYYMKFDILRQLMNETGFDYLFHRMSTHIESHSLIHLLGAMIPVPPKKFQVIEEEYASGNVLREAFEPFGLYIFSRSISFHRRFEVNSRIVIVGGGRTCLAFLEKLLFLHNPISNIYYTNITVLNPTMNETLQGLVSKKIVNMCFVSNGFYANNFIDFCRLETYVNCAKGFMTAINRKDKYITVDNQSNIPYDMLILLFGGQFQTVPLKNKTERMDEKYTNLFMVNDERDAEYALFTIKNSVLFREKAKYFDDYCGKVVVYGRYLNALCMIAALIELGLSPKCIVFVDPGYYHENFQHDTHPEISNYFNHRDVIIAVYKEMRKLGIKIYKHVKLLEWKVDSKSKTIKSATFGNKSCNFDLITEYLFCFHMRTPNYETFLALTKCGLVFDGGLVIDNHFRTTDPNILSAGEMTKYSKRFYADHLNHRFFNSVDIGIKLALEVERRLVPCDHVSTEGRIMQNIPVVRYCQLPGGLYYLKVRSTGKVKPLKVQEQESDYGHVLTTGDLNDLNERGYFRLHLNSHNIVETITCLSKNEIHVHNMIKLHGQHASFLNDLLLRYEAHLIDDLFTYFKGAWLPALLDQNFEQLVENFDKIAAHLETPNGEIVMDKVLEKFESINWRQLSEEEFTEIQKWYDSASYSEIIKEKVIAFLEKYQISLPMYATPLFARILVNAVEDHVLFMR